MRTESIIGFMVVPVIWLAACASVFAMCGACGPDHSADAAATEGGREAVHHGVFETVSGEAALKDGVKKITYEQFMKIRDSGDPYLLLDVLSKESYESGHIEGAKNFPADTISEESAAKMLPKDANIIVYCGSFQCTASTKSAEKLGALGYKTLDYKGGLKEWQEEGNSLVK